LTWRKILVRFHFDKQPDANKETATYSHFLWDCLSCIFTITTSL